MRVKREAGGQVRFYFSRGKLRIEPAGLCTSCLSGAGEALSRMLPDVFVAGQGYFRNVFEILKRDTITEVKTKRISFWH